MMSFYLPTFLAVAAAVWLLATQVPQLLKDSPVPDSIQKTYRRKPGQLAICISALLTIALILYYGDVKWGELVDPGAAMGDMTVSASDLMQGGGTSYFGDLLPAEKYGLMNTTGANPATTSLLSGTQFDNVWASGPGPTSKQLRNRLGGPGPNSQGISP